jgi:hypothetical protein
VTDDRLYDLDEAARYLRCSTRWLRSKVAAREVPHTRPARKILFTPGHLAQIVAMYEEPVICTRALALAHPPPAPAAPARRGSRR